MRHPSADDVELYRQVCRLPRECRGPIRGLVETPDNAQAITLLWDAYWRVVEGKYDQGVYLWGGAGVGKSTLLMSLAWDMAWSIRPWTHARDISIYVPNGTPVTVRWVTAPNLFAEIYAGMDGGPRFNPWAYIEPEILFVDDIGKATKSPYAYAELFRIIQERASAGLGTYYTSNYSPKGLMVKLVTQMGEASIEDVGPLVDRIAGSCEVFELRGPSWRTGSPRVSAMTGGAPGGGGNYGR